MSAEPHASEMGAADTSIALSPRLSIRHLRDADAALIQPLADNWEIAKQTLSSPYPYSMEDAHRFIEAARRASELGKEQVFVIERRSDSALIGLIGLTTDVAPVEIGYWLGAPFWGQGFASEAICAVRDYAHRTLACARLDAIAFNDNHASIRVLIKCGFRHLEDASEDFPARGGIRTLSCYRWQAGQD